MDVIQVWSLSRVVRLEEGDQLEEVGHDDGYHGHDDGDLVLAVPRVLRLSLLGAVHRDDDAVGGKHFGNILI